MRPFFFGRLLYVNSHVHKQCYRSVAMASLRTRSRKDGSSYHSVLYRLNGRQTSTSFEDVASATKFRDLVDIVGPLKAFILSFLYEWLLGHSGRDRRIVPALRACSTSTVSGARRDETTGRRYSHSRRMDTAAERRLAPRNSAQY